MEESAENINNDNKENKVDEIEKKINEISEDKLIVSPENNEKDKIQDKEATSDLSSNIPQANNNNSENKEVNAPLLSENIDPYAKLKDDHLILIERTKIFCIPYFNFGFTTHFFCPCKKLPPRIKLSEMPTPPFTIGPNCKSIRYNSTIKFLK